MDLIVPPVLFFSFRSSDPTPERDPIPWKGSIPLTATGSRWRTFFFPSVHILAIAVSFHVLFYLLRRSGVDGPEHIFGAGDGRAQGGYRSFVSPGKGSGVVLFPLLF